MHRSYNSSNGMKKICIPIIIVFSLLAGCATAKGDLFEHVTAPAPGSLEEDTEQTYDETVDEADDYTAGIEIETRPRGAQVYVDRKYEGLSDIFIENPSTGEYLIRIQKDGYYPVEEWVWFEEDSYLYLSYDLEEILGYLDVTVTPPGADIRVNGRQAPSMPAALRIGMYSLDISLFGYVSWSDTVAVREGQTTTVTAALAAAPFAVHDATVSRRAFNPGNPGVFGTTDIRFITDNRGGGKALVLDSSETVVRTMGVGPFTEWDQSVTWDGLDDAGRPVPDGRYIVRIEASGEDGSISETSTTTAVDRTLVIQPRSFSAGYSGLLFCPTPDILSEENLQVSVVATGQSRGGTAYVPVQAGLRFTLPGSLEGALQGTLLAVSGEDDGYSLGLSVKHPLTDPSSELFSLALGGKITFQGVRYSDTLTNFTGLSLALPAGMHLGPLKLYLAPEAVVSYNRVFYGYTATQSPGFYSWAYGRAGIALEIPGFSIGVSAALRTLPFSSGLAIHMPMEIGAETHFILPGSQFFGSLYGICEIEFADPPEYILLFGGGLHFIY